MLREGGWGSGYGVRFVGHAEHADIVDLVAEHHQTGSSEFICGERTLPDHPGVGEGRQRPFGTLPPSEVGYVT